MRVPLAYPHAQAVAHAVQNEIANHGIEPLMPLPYNRYEPAKSMWWINPSKENPAFKHGKYAFTPDADGADEFFCGMHIEKGFGPAAAMIMTTAKEKRNLMKPDWIWHRFVADLKAGKLDALVAAMAAGVGHDVSVEIGAYYYKGGDFDPYSSDDDWDVVTFSASRGGKLALDAAASKTRRSLLTAAAKAGTLAELGKAIDPVPTHEWVWINFWIGADFRLDPTSKKPGGWEASRLWNDLLMPLRPWFV